MKKKIENKNKKIKKITMLSQRVHNHFFKTEIQLKK